MNRDKMAKLEREERKWETRDRKLRKRKSLSMVVSNKGLRDLILPIIGKKSKPKPTRKDKA